MTAPRIRSAVTAPSTDPVYELLRDMAAFIRGDTPDDECDVPGCDDPWCCSHDAEALLDRFDDLVARGGAR